MDKGSNTDQEDRELFEAYLNGTPLHSGEKRKKAADKKAPQIDDETLFRAHLEENAVVAKDDHIAKREPLRKPTKKDVARIPSRDTLDLHGHTAEEAKGMLLAFLKRAYTSQRRLVLIIHGKGLHSGGKGVLKRMVHRVITQDGAAYALKSMNAPAQKGGSGATVVWIRRR
jgi:DNA-nicking Smr family endonuclease